MKKFRVTGKGTEYFQEREILAETAEEAEEQYYDLWTAGQIAAGDYDMEYTTTEEGEGEDDE